jgi:hypothetical protein
MPILVFPVLILERDRTGFGWWRKVERGLRAVVDVRRNGYALDSVAMKAFGYLLQHVR